MIIRLLQDVDLLKYFLSKNPNYPTKLISHIIGWDHNVTKESENKKHLILLNLLRILKKSHDEMLYIGNDKDIIEHLKSIKICKTYLSKTNGLTKNALQDIQRTHF